MLVSLGNPYLLGAVPSVGSYLLAWGGREVSQRAAARAVAGAEPIGGRLPVTIPGLHELGEGLTRAAIPAIAAIGEPRTDLFDEAGPPPGGGRRASGGGGSRDGPRRGGARPPPPAPAGAAGAGELARPRRLPARGRSGPRRDGRRRARGARRLYRGGARRLRRPRSRARRGPPRPARPGSGATAGSTGIPRAQRSTPYSLYDLASLTKVVGTTTAIMMLAGEGAVDLDAPVVRYLPEFASGDGRKASRSRSATSSSTAAGFPPSSATSRISPASSRSAGRRSRPPSRPRRGRRWSTRTSGS